jgi:predicted Zn-dependent protease
MSDLYSHDTDLFIAGMAAGGSKVAVLSLHRYHPNVKMSPEHWDHFTYAGTSSNYPYYEESDNKKLKKNQLRIRTEIPLLSSLSRSSQTEYLRRSVKLIVHEICHVYGIDHCIHYHCLMNGTGFCFYEYCSEQ